MTWTQIDVARNAKAVRNLGARLEAWGLSDPYERAESIARNLVLDGYQKPEPPPPPPTGPSSTRAGREAARKLFEETLKKTKETTR